MAIIPVRVGGGEAIRLAVAAMATRFELVLPVGLGTPEAKSLRAAGEEALAEIGRVEDWLSIYRPHTDLARVNAGAAAAPVTVSPPVFALLGRVRELSRQTGRTFDPTVGPLIRLWRAGGWPGNSPQPESQAPGAAVGWAQVELDAKALTVRFHHPAARLDLGAAGKGWAVDRALELLRESGVTSALLHGGTSTVGTLGTPLETDCWRIEIAAGDDREVVAAQVFQALIVPLRNETLSVSGTWGRTRTNAAGESHGHLFDPRTGSVVPGPRRAVVAGPSATDTDALSTALLVTGPTMLAGLAAGEFGPGLRAWFG